MCSGYHQHQQHFHHQQHHKPQHHHHWHHWHHLLFETTGIIPKENIHQANSHSHSQVNGGLEKVVAALQEIFEVVANTEVTIPLIILQCH